MPKKRLQDFLQELHGESSGQLGINRTLEKSDKGSIGCVDGCFFSKERSTRTCNNITGNLPLK